MGYTIPGVCVCVPTPALSDANVLPPFFPWTGGTVGTWIE